MTISVHGGTSGAQSLSPKKVMLSGMDQGGVKAANC